ncbi:IS1236 transposase domain protein [Leptospira noguchii str. Cascata]|nr:IS1236 transposase domain protein [Leptospira noguchii str. Cascata]
MIYLCVILDLYSRKVVGWSISNSNDSKLVCTALSKAIECRNPPKGLVFHSDRGSNYCSYETRRYLLNNKLRRSIVEREIVGTTQLPSPSLVL